MFESSLSSCCFIIGFDSFGTSSYIYFFGKGVSEDAYEALKWYRMAADQDDAAGQCGLGRMYSWGIGVEQDDYESQSVPTRQPSQKARRRK